MGMDETSEKETTGSGFGDWLQKLFSGNGFVKNLFSFLFGFGGDEQGSESTQFIREVPANRVADARQLFLNTQNGHDGFQTAASLNDPVEGVKFVRKWLSEAGVDASALDPTGKKSAEEMEVVLRDAPKHGYLAQARALYESITSSDKDIRDEEKPGSWRPGGDRLLDDPAEIAKEAEARLAKANQIALANGEKAIDLSALDPTGTKSASQVRNDLHEKMVQGYIIRAREELDALRSSPHHVYEESDNKAWDLLAKANAATKEYGFKPVDASALDPEGKQSATAMNRQILKAIEDEHFQEASQILYLSQRGKEGSPEEAAHGLREQLAAANKAAAALGDKPIDASMLAPNGGKYLGYIDHESEGLATLATPVGHAAQEFGIIGFRDVIHIDPKELQRIEHYSGNTTPLETPLNIPASDTRQKGG
jgi:hypothetical protein